MSRLRGVDGERLLASDRPVLRQAAPVGQPQYPLLGPLVDITTTLDPRFELAYRYGAIFLSEPRPTGAGRAEEGAAVLRKGILAQPRSWRLRWDLASAYYFFLHDPQRAAQASLEGARLPGAPSWLEGMAAIFLAKGGERAAAREVWRRQYEGSPEGILRTNASLHLKRLDAMDEADAVRSAVAKARERSGALPGNLNELVAAGLEAALPRDPSGTPFYYDAATGRVAIARKSPLWGPALPGDYGE